MAFGVLVGVPWTTRLTPANFEFYEQVKSWQSLWEKPKHPSKSVLNSKKSLITKVSKLDIFVGIKTILKVDPFSENGLIWEFILVFIDEITFVIFLLQNAFFGDDVNNSREISVAYVHSALKRAHFPSFYYFILPNANSKHKLSRKQAKSHVSAVSPISSDPIILLAFSVQSPPENLIP